jgi:hypothetical protein
VSDTLKELLLSKQVMAIFDQKHCVSFTSLHKETEKGKSLLTVAEAKSELG